MKIVAIAVFAVLMTGCGTTHRMTVEACDITQEKFMLIPYRTMSECRSTSEEGSEGGIQPPRSGV